MMKAGRTLKKSKRRRIVHLEKMGICAVLITMALSFSILGGSGLVSAHDSRQSEPIDYQYYTSIKVHAGDSLWSIAEEYMDKDHYDSVDSYMKELIRINHLDSSTIHEGCFLTVSYWDSDFR